MHKQNIHIGRLSTLGIATSLMLSLWSCSNSDIDMAGGSDKNPDMQKYFITLNVALPTANTTKTTTDAEGNTSSDGPVEGTAKENEIKSASITIVEDNKVKFTLQALTPFSKKENTVTMNADITNDMDNLVDLAGKTVSILVVANTTESGTNHTFGTQGPFGAFFSVSPLDSSEDPSPVGDFGTEGKTLPLMNAADFTIKIPKGSSPEETLQLIQNLFSVRNETGAYYPVEGASGRTIYLERAVARVEYRDAEGRTSSSSLPNEANTYYIGNSENQIRLDQVKLFNVMKKSYVFRHSAVGTALTSNKPLKTFGDERGITAGKYTWVPSCDWVTSTTNPTLPDQRDFHNALETVTKGYVIGGDQEWTYISSSEEHTGIEDRTPSDNDGYHPWCYVTENTLPNTDYMTKENLLKYATGVAFKFIVLQADGKTPLEYSPSRQNYPAGILNATGSNNKAITIFMPDQYGEWMDVTPEEDGHYYLTYVGCIVHNDDRSYTGTSIAPMKYGVVRNNTYQISVTAIKGLPFPDNAHSMFLDMNVKVRQWVKRHNGVILE